MARFLPTVALVLLLAAAFVFSGCADSSRSPAADPHAHMTHERTPGGVLVMAPAEVTEQPGWPDALREIDLAVAGFQNGIGGRRLAVTLEFHDLVHDPVIQAATRACYVGDGKIDACYHEPEAHVFCLAGALRDLAAAQYPELAEWQLDWGEAIANSWLEDYYGRGVRLD